MNRADSFFIFSLALFAQSNTGKLRLWVKDAAGGVSLRTWSL